MYLMATFFCSLELAVEVFLISLESIVVAAKKGWDFFSVLQGE